jgi:hypothetical protein
MKKIILFMCLLIPLFAQADISVDFYRPAPTERVPDNLAIQVSVSSTYSYNIIRATVEGRTIDLTRATGMYIHYNYEGTLSLIGLSQGTHQLSVYVEDIYGNNKTFSEPFYYNSLPVVKILEPSENNFFQSKIHVRATVTDAGVVKALGRLTFGMGYSGSFLFYNSVDTVLDIAGDGKVGLQLDGIDSLNSANVTTTTVNVYKESSPYLYPVFIADSGQIVGFRDNRLLTTTTVNRLPYYQIVHMNDSTTERIVMDSSLVLSSDVKINLCEGGAAFVLSNDLRDVLYLWRNGALINISDPLGETAGGLSTTGHYLVWSTQSGKLALTDLTTLTTSYVSINITGDFSINEDGLITYNTVDVNAPYRIYTYNISTGQTKQTAVQGVNAITSGPFLIYQAYNPNPPGNSPIIYSIHITDGVTDSVLTTSQYNKEYTARNGYVLYSKPDNQQIQQVWLRNPQGQTRQLGFFADTESYPGFLGPNGQAIFWANYAYNYNDSLINNVQIASQAGTLYYRDSAYYLTEGSALLRFNISAFKLPADNFTIVNTDASCKGDANGAISVTAKQSLNYMATLTGNGLDSSLAFTTTATFNSLTAGTYQLCLTVNGQPDYQQCFTLVISEPAPVKFDMTGVNGREATLTLSGGKIYYVTLNGNTTATTNSQLTITLQNGNNQLSISTDKLCQGTIVKNIVLSGIMAFPNPFDQAFTLQLPPTDMPHAVISIYDAAGRNVWSRSYEHPANAINLDLSGLASGFYLLKLSTGQDDQIIKLIKK